MQPFASLTELPRQLQQDAVRELAWTLLATPLLDAPAASVRHPLTASDWAARPERLADWLLQLDRQPQPLLDWLARQPIHRLGHHYERLWQFAALAAPGVELLGHNLAVREGNRTLGELDLLLRDAEGIQPIELAVKFYLGLPSAAHAPRWYGPDPRDRLDLKLGHLYRQQLPLAGLAAARALLPGTPQPSSLWLGGWLFYPLAQALEAPAHCPAGHPRGNWCTLRDWQPGSAACWSEIPRLSWLAPLCRQQPPAACELTAPLSRPRLLARMARQTDGSWHEQERWFITPDDWPGIAEDPAGPQQVDG